VAQQQSLVYIGLQFDRGEISRPDDHSGKDSFKIGQTNYEMSVSASDCTRDKLVWSRDVPRRHCCCQTWNYYIY
jgi:hypothetical protein